MDGLRDRLERHFLTRAAGFIDGTLDERRDELEARLAEVEAVSQEVREVEEVHARLVERLGELGAGAAEWSERVERLSGALDAARTTLEHERARREAVERDLREALARAEETAELGRRETRLAAREAELQQRVEELSDAYGALEERQREADRRAHAPELLAELDRREQELAERERRFEIGERFVLTERGRIQEARERLSAVEHELVRRTEAVADREHAADEAAAAWEAEVDLRERQLSRAEAAIGDRERHVSSRERTVEEYVARAQSSFAGR
jgi:chromosome segregation protein